MGANTESSHPVRGTGKDALVNAAIEILAGQGVRAVTYRSVAERAGVTHGLVRHHFTTLSELLKTAVREWAQSSIDYTTIEPQTGRIEDIAGDLPADLAQNADEHLAMYELALISARTGEMRDEVKEIYRRYAQAVSRELDRAGIPDGSRLGRTVFAAIDGLVLQQLVTGDSEVLEDGLDDLRTLLAARLR